MNAFTLPLTLMLLCVLGELALRRWLRGEAAPWREVVFNLGSGHILMWYFRGIEIAAFAFVVQHANLHWVDRWPVAAQWLFALLAWDFCFYWMHRLHHTVPLLWAVHVVHHEGEHYGLSLGIRNSWYSSLTNLPFVIGLAVLGVPVEVFVVVSSIHYTVQFYNHNSFVRHSGLLERFLITPAHHRVHHATHPACIDRNYGGTFLWWDRLFRTFQRAPAGVTLHYGVDGPRSSHNPLIASNVPLMRLFGRCTSGLHPGRFAASEATIGLGGVLLFAAVIHYIDRDGTWPPLQQEALALLIFLGTIALGAASDGRRWGALAWALITLPLPAIAWLPEASMGWAGRLIYSLLALHGVFMLTLLLVEPLADAQVDPPAFGKTDFGPD